MDIKKKLEGDLRYKAVNISTMREDYFYDFIKILKEERKKKKAKKSDKKEKKKKSKDKDRTSKDKSELVENSEEALKPEAQSEELKEEVQGEKIVPMDVDENKSDDGSEKSDSDKDDEGEHSGTDSESDRLRKDRDRQARAEASIKQREKEVEKKMAENLRERDKERQHHKRDEAVRHFTALLADLVRNSDLTWKEVKKQLKKDHRWELVDNLNREDKERLFNDHISSLTKKKRDKFREMLDEIKTELTSTWKTVKRQVRDDPRFLKFGNGDRVRLHSFQKFR